MTVHEVLTSINDIRSLTCPPSVGEGPKEIGIDQTIEADAKLLALQERLLNDYGKDPQTTTF